MATFQNISVLLWGVLFLSLQKFYCDLILFNPMAIFETVNLQGEIVDDSMILNILADSKIKQHPPTYPTSIFYHCSKTDKLICNSVLTETYCKIQVGQYVYMI